MKKLVFALDILATMTACRSSQLAQIGALGSDQKVTLYSASGAPIRQWVSNGKVSTEKGSDGFFFSDRATGKLVRVTGTLVIEAN